jgi:CBS domain-containing protein
MTESLPASELSLFRRRARELVRRPPVTCRPDTPVGAAAATMSAERVGSVVVVDGAGSPVGIVTLRDIGSRVVAAGRASDVPVSVVMSSPLLTVAADAFAFDAWLAMARRGIHHLGVLDGGRLVGVLGGDDFAGAWLVDPVTLVRDIDTCPTADALVVVAPRLPDLVRRLVGDGASPFHVGEVVAELNDRLVRRVVTLAEARLEDEGLGRPPGAYSWLAAGSEGRREQTLRTDQDSGLVYADPPPGGEAAASGYFERLAARVGADLLRLGFARCTGGFMAENPRWRRPVSAWRETILGWFREPSPEAVLAASLYLDLRAVAGDGRPGAALRDVIVDEGPRYPLFHRYLARAAVDRRPPLGLFGRIAVRRSGPRKGTFDIKARGVFPVTQAMRVYALALGLGETNTLDRLAGAEARGVFAGREAQDLRQAYGAILRVRLDHQVEAVAAGVAPDNDIAPDRLARVDRLVLKEAFRTVARLQRALADRFQVALVG